MDRHYYCAHYSEPALVTAVGMAASMAVVACVVHLVAWLPSKAYVRIKSLGKSTEKFVIVSIVVVVVVAVAAVVVTVVAQPYE